MIFRLIFCLLLIFKILDSFAQDSTYRYPAIIIKTFLFAPIDPILPTIRFSSEFIINKHWGIEAGVGIKYLNTSHADTNQVRDNGFKTYLELRYYLKNKSYGNWYYAMELFLTKNSLNDNLTYYKDSTALKRPYNPSFVDSSITESYGVKRIVSGMNLKLGYQVKAQRIIIDLYMGAGLRYRNIKNFNREYDPKKGKVIHRGPDACIGCDMDLQESSGFYPSLTMGVKIGYLLKK